MDDCGMKLFVGLDVSLEKTAICVISEHGKIVKEAQVAKLHDVPFFLASRSMRFSCVANWSSLRIA